MTRDKIIFWKDFEINILKYFKNLPDIYSIIENKIPCSLVKEITNMVNTKEKSYDILHQVFNKMYIDLREKIWIPRCEEIIKKEKENKITQKLKRSINNTIDKIRKKNKLKNRIIDRNKLPLKNNIKNWQTWIEKEIRFGFL